MDRLIKLTSKYENFLSENESKRSKKGNTKLIRLN